MKDIVLLISMLLLAMSTQVNVNVPDMTYIKPEFRGAVEIRVNRDLLPKGKHRDFFKYKLGERE